MKRVKASIILTLLIVMLLVSCMPVRRTTMVMPASVAFQKVSEALAEQKESQTQD